MLRHGILAGLVLHQVARYQEALFSFLFYHLLGVLGIGLLFWEVHDADISALSSKKNGYGAADPGASAIICQYRVGGN